MDTPTAVRSTARVFRPFHTFEGEGFPVRRPFPQPELPLVDPFPVVDQVGPHVLGPGEARGTPPHPRRGFETVQYVIDGAVEDIDSDGHRRVVYPGGVQWLTAGSGLVHLARPTPELLAEGGPQHPRLALLARDGDRFAVSAPGGPAEVLVLAGEPIGEPVARTGPFVMNDAAGIRRAQLDYQRGLMGRIDV
ncbi:pirin family protein [Streptomyces sp. HUAS TT3]|uniref:pirin family protein n=1 Tax=Streptomyces sp. HUAS TT3 TaxID=3447510 RepID=UPI003F654B90